MAFKFPYSNLHELNLDWILKEVKRFADLIPPMESATEDVAHAVELSEQAIELATEASQAVVADGSITTSKLADDAVTQIKLADGAVTTIKIDDGAVETAKLNNLAVTSIKIANNAVTNGKIADGAVTWDKLNSSAQDKINYKILYFTGIPCSAMTGDFAVISNTHINTNHVFVKADYADPSAIVGNVGWTSANGTFTLNGTCNSATTVDILIIEKGN